jgi:Flp pilus assembly CpaF family ATPase
MTNQEPAREIELIIRGKPGSGKTTLAQMLAVLLSTNRFIVIRDSNVLDNTEIHNEKFNALTKEGLRIIIKEEEISADS